MEEGSLQVTKEGVRVKQYAKQQEKKSGCILSTQKLWVNKEMFAE